VFFLETFDPIQMRYAGHEYKRLVDYVELLARDAGSVRYVVCTPPHVVEYRAKLMTARSCHRARTVSHDPP
jgi:hypothetical protein